MNTITRVGGILLAGAAMATVTQHVAEVRGLPSLQIAAPAQAASVEIGIFFDRLAPHGTWTHHPRYGYVFVPAVGPGWRPYVHGRWVYTDEYGWYWVSDEPFAWAVYHYGRWFYDPVYGWCWVPGNVWAPAWVTWRHGGGSVGWAAIGPHDAGYVYGTPDYYDPYVVEAWVFVPERRFVAVDLARYVAPVVEINIFLGKAREKHHVHYRDGRVHNAFLPRDRVRQFTKADIEVFKVQAVHAPDQAAKAPPKGKDRVIRSFQADIAKAKPDDKPKKVATKPEEVKSKPTLKSTANKGERPQDAPPSAAELSKERAAPDRVEGGPDGKSGAPAAARDSAEEKPATKQADEPKAGEPKPGDAKSAEPGTPPEPKAAEPKAAEPKSAEPKSAGPKPGDRPEPPQAKGPDKPGGKQAEPAAPDAPTPPQADAPARPKPPQASAPQAPQPPGRPQPPAAAPPAQGQAGPPQPPAQPSGPPPQAGGPSGPGGPGPDAAGPPGAGRGPGPAAEGPPQGGGGPRQRN